MSLVIDEQRMRPVGYFSWLEFVFLISFSLLMMLIR